MSRKAYFNEAANTWDEKYYTPELASFLEKIVPKFGLSSGQSILDVGTGTGILIPYLVQAVGRSGSITAIDYAEEMVHLRDIKLAEGSGISRKNRLSALDFLAILKRFAPHRTLLESDGRLLYKTGSLKNVNTRAGYIECASGRPFFFVILQNGSKADIEFAIENLKKFALTTCRSRD